MATPRGLTMGAPPRDTGTNRTPATRGPAHAAGSPLRACAIMLA